MEPSGNLWQQMLRDCSVRVKVPSVNLLVAGDPESGKRLLLSRLDESGALANGSADAEPVSQDSVLAYAAVNVLDPKAKEGGSAADASDDVIAKLATWKLNALEVKELVQIAVKPQNLKHTVVAVVLDLARPWAIKSSLEQWTSALEGQLLHQINQLAPEARNDLYAAIKQHILAYEDPGIDHSAPTPMDTGANDFMEEGVLFKNLGVPFVIVVAKADLRPEGSLKMDYIEYYLRQFAIKYGASVFYTSAKTGDNIDALRKYIVHRAYPDTFKFLLSPQLVERSSIMIPSGYDSFTLVEQSLLGSQPRWAPDSPFEKMVPCPAEEVDDPAVADIRVDSHDRWLEKLEKAAGAGLEELQKQSVEASKKAEAAAAARRAAAERRKREEKDVSSKHLANFFNNLLSRPEKTKSGRTLGDQKKKDKSDVKSLAEEELKNLSKRA